MSERVRQSTADRLIDKRQRRRRFLSTLGLALLGGGASLDVAAQGKSVAAQRAPRTIRVGPRQQVRTLREASAIAAPGDTVEVEAGDYVGDVALWDKAGVRIVGVGGRPRLIANGAHVDGKAIFLVRAIGVQIENLEFHGARVPDHFGNGIRLERGTALVKQCRFVDNEIGLMTANRPNMMLEVESCEFSGLVSNIGRGDALSHSLYAGAIDLLRVEGCYFHDGSVGHLLKSRARFNSIRYNRLTDEGGISSYELEFPDGGIAEVVGNIIQQGRRSQNPVIVSYGAEGRRWKENRLDALFNTIVNDRSEGGAFFSVRTADAAVRIRENVLVGDGRLEIRARGDIADNVRASPTELTEHARFDYRPRVVAPWVAMGSSVQPPYPESLLPTHEYVHPASVRPLRRRTRLMPLNPGALQTVGP